MTRDYLAEFAKLLDEATQHTPYSPRAVASDLVARLQEEDPDLLDGFLRAQAVQVVWDGINRRERSQRARTAAVGSRIAFSAALEAHAGGDSGLLAQFLDTVYPVGGVRKRLSELTVADLDEVAGSYEQRSAEQAMHAAFLRVLAKQLRGNRDAGTVGDLFTDDQLARLWQDQRHPRPPH